MQISKSRYKRKKNEVVKKDYWVTEQDDFILYLHTECENVIFLQNLKEIKEILRMEYR